MATKPVDPRINIIGNFLVTDISITDVSSVINNSGFMEIQVVGINKTAFYKQFEYKIEWLDNNGLKISTIMSRWTTFPAYEKSEFRFKAVAPKKTATNYRILIRKGGN
ncbi:MAG: YcfL family protein [Proteobacteria bacterium]|nr:YcfL family protein [Pseudomonadota bacterium]